MMTADEQSAVMRTDARRLKGWRHDDPLKGSQLGKPSAPAGETLTPELARYLPTKRRKNWRNAIRRRKHASRRGSVLPTVSVFKHTARFDGGRVRR